MNTTLKGFKAQAAEIRRLTKKLGMTPEAAAKAETQFPVPLRKPDRPKGITARHRNKIIKLTKAGLIQRAIAERIGVSQHSVHATLRKHGCYVYVTHAEYTALVRAGICPPPRENQ